jgi:hypothetical protein
MDLPAHQDDQVKTGPLGHLMLLARGGSCTPAVFFDFLFCFGRGLLL